MATLRVDQVLFKNIQAIVFDKDGTLEDSQAILKDLGQARSRLIDHQIPGLRQRLLPTFGIIEDWLNPAGLMAVGSRRENEIAAAACIAETGQSWSESLKIARQAFEKADQVLQTSSPAPLFRECLGVLELLSTSGLKLGILSAASSKSVYSFVKRYHLEQYFQLKMGVDEGPGKPDPKLFLQACQALDVNPLSAVMIGDAMVDMEMARGAKAAGCIGIDRQGQIPQLLQSADVVIQNLDQIQVISVS
ncbi:MAG: HAD family hydrolase [Microcoleaceae cyanobacterium]